MSEVAPRAELFALSRTRLIVPVFNGGDRWREAARAIRASFADPASVLVVDSGSTDGSDSVAKESGFELQRIESHSFNHGGTRQWAIEQFCAAMEYVVFLTQDAVLEGPQSIAALIGAFSDPAIGAAYGRQVPQDGAGPFEAHVILFNYGVRSETRSIEDAPRLGIKTAYLSNSFAAYRLSALAACGGFPNHLILGEDTCVAVNMLLAGWKIRYCADARVRHSHAYTIAQDVRRYFDFGVLHAQLPELLRHFGTAEGEGARFVFSELRYCAVNAPLVLPVCPVRNAAKYIGYRLGREFRRLPRGLCRRLSMTKVFWDGAATSRSRVGP